MFHKTGSYLNKTEKMYIFQIFSYKHAKIALQATVIKKL
jgi:hypothetical protein